MQISSLIFFLYQLHDRGYALEKSFALRAPLAVTANWHIVRENRYALIRRLDINQTLLAQPEDY